MIVCKVEHGKLSEPPDVPRNLAGDDVAGEVNDAEERQGRNAARDDTGNALPIGDGDAGELSEVAYGR